MPSSFPRPPRRIQASAIELRAALSAFVRRRVLKSDVDDIVQTTLTEALASPHAPDEAEARRRWIHGIARNTIVDLRRRRGRESFDLPELPLAPAPHVEADLLRWAERNLPKEADARRTLDWMLREGEGEKHELRAAVAWAADDGVAAP